MVMTISMPTAALRTRSVSSFVMSADRPASWQHETTTTRHMAVGNAGMARIVPFMTDAVDLRPITTGAAKQAAPPRGVPR